MRTIVVLAALMSVSLVGCGPDSEIFPNAPENSFIKTGIGPGPIPPTGPVSGHTSINPTGHR